MSETVTPAQAVAKFTALQRTIQAPFTGANQSAFLAEADTFISALKAAAPRKTGVYADSIEKRVVVNPRTARIEAWGEAPLTKWIIAGTRPHEIVPVNVSALHWYSATNFNITGGREAYGEDVFAKHVWHPGTKPNPWHEAPANAAAQSIAEKMVGAIVRSMANAV